MGNAEIITNDIAVINDRGQFILLGRRDNVINSGGIKIHPEHIERRIAHFLLRRFYVSSVSDPQFGERPILIVEGEPLEKLVEKDLLEAIGNELTSIEMPVRIEYIGHFDETETGKIKRTKS